MIISCTPLRISFAGGGTDFKGFYQVYAGCVVSSAIDKYIYVAVKDRFDETIRVSYSKTEIVDSVDDIQHDLVRECLRKVGIEKKIEVCTLADISSHGTGLGSSSTLTVGLLNALYAYKGVYKTAGELAEEACEIEIDMLKKPIGKQDQYIAAYGGLKRFDFGKCGHVSVQDISLSSLDKEALSDNLLLFYTGVTRRADTILSEQKSSIFEHMKVLKDMRSSAWDLCWRLKEGKIHEVGRTMQKGWEKKKQLASGITNPEIDALYQSAIDAGAIGGKITGAGGGGFLLVYATPERQATVRDRLSSLHEMKFGLCTHGSQIVYSD